MFAWVADALDGLLSGLHAVLAPVTGAAAWGWAVVALTVCVRLALTPLAVRQFHHMHRMQSLQPRVAAIRKAHAPDRRLVRTDPAAYRRAREQMDDEVRALYRAEGANPAGGCLPVVVQAPVLIALFRVLRRSPLLKNAPFYAFTATTAATAEYHGLGTTVREAGPGGWALAVVVVLLSALAQRQGLRARARAGGARPTAQQRLTAMLGPGMMALVSIGFPVGVLLYWATSSGWQWGQQAILLRRLATR